MSYYMLNKHMSYSLNVVLLVVLVLVA